jgi:hypothetical protein
MVKLFIIEIGSYRFIVSMFMVPPISYFQLLMLMSSERLGNNSNSKEGKHSIEKSKTIAHDEVAKTAAALSVNSRSILCGI